MKNLFPVGFNYKKEMYWYLAIVVASIITALTDLSSIFEAKRNLFYNGIYTKGDMAPDFIKVSDGHMFGFWLLMLFGVYMIYAHYKYHYQGTMSIYTMKRLKSKAELHVRCTVIPIVIIVLSFLMVVALKFLFFKVYMTILPAESIQPEQFEKLIYSIKHFNF